VNRLTLTLACLVAGTGAGFAQTEAAPEDVIAAQQAALAEIAWMDGTWQGPAWAIGTDGERIEITQTERVGPIRDGTSRVIEGLGYDAEGNPVFNAFAVVSYDPATDEYVMRSYSGGQQGSFWFDATDTGYVWEIPLGEALMRYTATATDGHWSQVGEIVLPGQEPQQVFGMELTRMGDTDWPAGGAVFPQ